MDRRHFVAGSAAAAAALAVRPAFAQDAYPSHAITIINPFPPGGAVDVVGRPFAAVLEPLLKQPVVIETKAGAAGQVGAQVAANAKPDGYTLLAHLPSISGFEEVDKTVRPRAEIHARRFHPDRAAHRRPHGAGRQRPAAVQDAQGAGRRRQETSGQDHLQLVRPLRRAASADRAVHEGRRHQDAASADQRRRTCADRHPRQQLAGAGVLRSRPQAARSRPASCARSPASRPSARPRCPTCRR